MMPDESTNSFMRIRHLFDEVYEIFTKCGQSCILCDTFIIQLHQHVKLAHGNGFPTNHVLTSTPGHMNHNNPIVEERLQRNMDPPVNVQAQAQQFCKAKLGGQSSSFVNNPNGKGHEFFTHVQNTPISVPIIGEKYFITCRCCHMSFNLKIDYEHHFNSAHPEEEPYKCDTCGKCFTKSQNLIRHDVRIHSGEISFKCETCGRRFPTLTNLNKHKTKNHSVEKPCKCVTCGKSFKSPSDLTRHSLVHTGERPHKCDICEMSFRQSTHLAKHMDKLHGREAAEPPAQKLHNCGSCGKTFSKPVSLTAHKIVCHTRKVNMNLQRREIDIRRENLHAQAKPYMFHVDNGIALHLV